MSATIIKMRMTVAGNEAVFNSKNTGFDLDLTHIQFGSGNKKPTGEEVALVTPQQTAPISGGTKIVTGNEVQIRMSAWFEGAVSYDICEIGIWSGPPDEPDSVLFAYWSQEEGRVAVMSKGVDFVFTHDMTLDLSVGEMLNIVIDPDASTALILMASHEANQNPHPQYALKTELAESWEEHLNAVNPHSQYIGAAMLASALFPTGTQMLFVQAAAPVGWTKVIEHNDKALRIVSGAGGGAGGSLAFSSAFSSRALSGSVGNTTLAEWQMPYHTHPGGMWQRIHPYGVVNFPGDGGNCDDIGPTSYTGGNGAHNHSLSMTALNMAVQYVDAIICRKD